MRSTFPYFTISNVITCEHITGTQKKELQQYKSRSIRYYVFIVPFAFAPIVNSMQGSAIESMKHTKQQV